MPLTAAQKNAVAQFTSITGASDKIAQRYLRNSSYHINQAIDAYFSANGSSRETALKNQFDTLRSADDDPDTIGAENEMKYFKSLGVNLEDASLFVALEAVKAESIGELKKDNFVNGWKEANIDATITAQKHHIKNVVDSMSTVPDLFRRVYRYAFVAGREPDQRALSLDHAVVYWQALFNEPGRRWVSKRSQINWLDIWIQFLRSKWTRSVNRDMWNQTLEFANKSIEDDTLSFWDPAQSWPGVIDDFVIWYQEKTSKGVSAMDVDA